MAVDWRWTQTTSTSLGQPAGSSTIGSGESLEVIRRRAHNPVKNWLKSNKMYACHILAGLQIRAHNQHRE